MNELYLWTLCNMWQLCWIMYDLGCMLTVNQDLSWYSTDYRVYMGSSMIVQPLVGCHCTCALINWSVLLQYRCCSSHRDRSLLRSPHSLDWVGRRGRVIPFWGCPKEVKSSQPVRVRSGSLIPINQRMKFPWCSNTKLPKWIVNNTIVGGP